MTTRETKPLIMCTLTPEQVFGRETLVAAMHRAGMGAVRINTAHLQGVDQLRDMAARLKRISRDMVVLVDTKGPEMRTTSLHPSIDPSGLPLERGEEVTLSGCDDDTPTTVGAIRVNYPGIHTEVRTGHEILIDDGSIRLRVTEVSGPWIKAVVASPGVLGSKKGLAVAGLDLDLPPVSQHDRVYIGFAASAPDIDVVAHSFVRRASDVEAVRRAMGASTKPVIAKIESQQGIDHLGTIISVSDGILIARGDLTASIGREAVPAAQQDIADAAKSAGLPLYLATNILPSLMRGTEVSASDAEGVRQAMAQGVDVMLLTNETAAGPRPLQSVQALSALMQL